MNLTEPDGRPVLGPAGNKNRSVELRKPMLKMKSEKTKQAYATDDNKGKMSPATLQLKEMTADRTPSPLGFRQNGRSAASILRCRQSNLSLNASCTSYASTDSSHSRASTGRISRRNSTPISFSERKKQCNSNDERTEKIVGSGRTDGCRSAEISDCSLVKKRCAWVTSNTDPFYAAFHDEEWGLPVHDDKKLFELFSFSTALAELTWPVILGRRGIFRDVFLDFDPTAVSKLQDKKIVAPGSPASFLLSELNLRSIIENARQICKIMDEHGTFDKYIWSFVNFRPILSNFRYPRQIPIKTSKAVTISKDLVRRGFRGVGPTVVYSFMQAAGITNDHLINCFRFHDCIVAGNLMDGSEGLYSKNLPPHDPELARNIDDLNLSRIWEASKISTWPEVARRGQLLLSVVLIYCLNEMSIIAQQSLGWSSVLTRKPSPIAFIEVVITETSFCQQDSKAQAAFIYTTNYRQIHEISSSLSASANKIPDGVLLPLLIAGVRYVYLLVGNTGHDKSWMIRMENAIG